MIDLHIHTTCSDGQLSVEEILKKARNIGILTISFCDHNVLNLSGGMVCLLKSVAKKKVHERMLQIKMIAYCLHTVSD